MSFFRRGQTGGSIMSAKTLRAKFTRQFVGMDKYSRKRAWIVFLSFVVQVIGAIAVGALLLGLETNPWTVIAIGCVMLFIGTRLRGINNIIHECSHATFSSERGDNAIIGKLSASLLFNSFDAYRDEHLSHHAHLGDYEHDMDLQGIRDLKLHEPLSARVITRHVVTPLVGRHLPYYLGLNMSSQDGSKYQWLKAAILLSAVAFTIAFPLTGALFVFAPFIFVYSALNYWADCLDHAGIVATEDDLTASRNLLAPGIVRWLFFPRNDCYHLVHHLFPHIPSHHLASSHALLTKDSLYSAQSNAVRQPKRAEQSQMIPAE